MTSMAFWFPSHIGGRREMERERAVTNKGWNTGCWKEDRETRETERQRDRETERQRDRETERQRDRETDGREREEGNPVFNSRKLFCVDEKNTSELVPRAAKKWIPLKKKIYFHSKIVFTADLQPKIEHGWKPYVCMYVCMYVRMYFVSSKNRLLRLSM
jgi:hypothetical protein